MKRIYLFLLIFCLCSQNMTAETLSGICGADGNNLTWSFDTVTGVLTISGTGAMRDYSNPFAPWYSYRSLIKTAVIEEGVTSIGGEAFIDCSSLISVTIPSSVLNIESYAFSYCTGLKGFIVSEGNARYDIIDGVLFSKDRDTLIAYPNDKAVIYTIPDGVTSVGNYAFHGCSDLIGINISNSVSSIGNRAFAGCVTLESVTVPDGVVSIEHYAFSGCSGLTSVIIGDGVTSIGNNVFWRCTGLMSVVIGNSVTSIGYSMFNGCSGLTSVSIPNSVNSIGSFAFAECSSLTGITIPNSVTSVGYYAFGGCSGLKEIHSQSLMPPSVGGVAFDEVSKVDCRIYVPSGAIAAYQAAGGWSAFTYILEEGDEPEPQPEDTASVKDSIVYNIFYKDTVVYNIIHKDTVVYNIIHKDSIDYALVPDTVYIPVVTDITGVGHIVTINARVVKEGDGILIQGLESNAEFSIYTVTGEKYYTGTADAAGEYRLSSIDEGLYILFFRDSTGKGRYSKFLYRKQ